MARILDEVPPRAALVEIAHEFHARGWMYGTAGNLSVRADDEHIWITASGKPKGRLTESDFVLVRVSDGAVIERVHPANQPSAETAIHQVLYRLFPQARACLHGHSVAGARVSARARRSARSLRLPPIEMLKGFDIWQRNPRIDLPLFANHLDVGRIARDIEARFRKTAPALTALMIRDHGPTVWGRSLQETYNRFECLEFLFDYAARGAR